MKIKILLFSFSFFTLTTHAQDSSFQLKDYKYRTDGYRALNLNLNLSGESDYVKADTAAPKKSRSFSLNGVTINYYKVKSTDKRVHSSSLYFGSSFSSRHFEENRIKDKETRSDYNFSWRLDDRFYAKNKWFLELGNTLNSGYKKYANTQKVFVKKAEEIDVNDELTVGFGKGRIENVQDAQMALFIINDLKSQGLITGNVDASTIYQFAQLITNINNKRIFDDRRKRIYELTQINNFLKEKGIVSEPDIRHFTTINDNWTLAFNPLRTSGSIWFARIKPIAGYNKTNQTFENDYEDERVEKYLGYTPVLGYENHKPISLKWQRDFTLSVAYSINDLTIESKNLTGTPINSKADINQTDIYLQSFYGLSYYPNNRTVIYGGLFLQGGEQKREYLGVLKNKYILSSFSLGTDYFLSYRTRLHASISGYARLLNQSTPNTTFSYNVKDSYANFNLSLLHSFF